VCNCKNKCTAHLKWFHFLPVLGYYASLTWELLERKFNRTIKLNITFISLILSIVLFISPFLSLCLSLFLSLSLSIPLSLFLPLSPHLSPPLSPPLCLFPSFSPPSLFLSPSLSLSLSLSLSVLKPIFPCQDKKNLEMGVLLILFFHRGPS